MENLYRKKFYKKYINSSDEEIREIAKDKLKLSNSSKKKQALLQFDKRGRCPFFTEDKLCKIHQRMGGKALSYVCATYPRTQKIWGDQVRNFMSMSCPEVARLVLFEQDSMLLHEENNLIGQAAKSATFSGQASMQKNQLIHLFACHLVSAKSSHIEANLFALAQFILYLQRINFDLSGRLSEVEAFYEELITALHNGQLTANNIGSKQALLLKLNAITAIFNNDKDYTHRNIALRRVYALIIKYLDLKEVYDNHKTEEKFLEINIQWQKLCAISCLAEPHVLRNYLHYQIYMSCFPGNDLSLIMRNFYRIVMDYFILKLSLTVLSMHQEIDQKAVLHLFSDYYQYIQHNSAMLDKLDKAINTINGGDDLSCLLLLG